MLKVIIAGKYVIMFNFIFTLFLFAEIIFKEIVITSHYLFLTHFQLILLYY